MIERYKVKCGPSWEYDLADKINELVDWANKIQERLDTLGEEDGPKV